MIARIELPRKCVVALGGLIGLILVVGLVVILPLSSQNSAFDEQMETRSAQLTRYRNLVAEVLATRRKRPEVQAVEILEGWQASRSIERERELQTLIAALHCSYPRLLPQRIQEMSEKDIVERVEKIKWMLQR